MGGGGVSEGGKRCGKKRVYEELKTLKTGFFHEKFTFFKQNVSYFYIKNNTKNMFQCYFEHSEKGRHVLQKRASFRDWTMKDTETKVTARIQSARSVIK